MPAIWTGADYRNCRDCLFMSQSQWARLWGVHVITVSRWENDRGAPRPWIRSLMLSCCDAHCNHFHIGKEALRVLDGSGAPAALFVILRAAYGDVRN